jgi:Outer membrane protein beta-barrel domain
MKHFVSVTFIALLATAPAALAQKWEVGVAGGGSFSTSQTFKNAVTHADAGLSNGLAVSAWLGNNSNGLISGELRYDYEHTDLKLSSGGTNVNFGAMTNAIHYDFVLHFAPSESHIRPFVSAGAGVKLFTGTGKEQEFQPLSNVALLTKTSEVKPLIALGGGVKVSLSPAVQLRLEAHDFLTPFPKNVIAPAQGATVGGWLQDFVVMAGLSFTF